MNIDEIMKMAGNVQKQVADAQAQLDKIEVEGASGGGLVRVRATAKGRIVKLTLDDSLMEPGSKEMTEDLIVAALNDARAKADAASQSEMKRLTAGLPLPPGFSF